ncbi:hypothetical protein HOLleu_35946 [Holothuria leucospilota]|uniref:ATP-dependent DNA helicase n=1 Tax=Holothuria leucospilota TaxID=206669 RepID=A0A9Q0YMU6_HOLLE|nr:hypothetical protein HOLleu_35946 [Holothuria leucospilota]
MKDGQNLSHEEFLQQLNLTHSQYITRLQSSIQTPTIFLERTPKEMRTNPYMKNLRDTYGANHDIQFVTDPYACAVYIVAYMSKSQRGTSLLLDQACKEPRAGNSDIQNQVRTIGNKFLNAVEVSAQEAAYLLLQLPITRSSSKENLQQMDPNDTDIESGNIIKRYAVRPHILKGYCLADYASKITMIYPKDIQDPYDDCYEDDPSQMNDGSRDEASLLSRAGVSKSVVVRVLYQSIHRYLNSIEGTGPDDCKIIMCAPTGKAAFNINGQTIHSAFQINPNRGYNFLKLNSDKLNSLQVKYRHLQVVIIDEISMVGSRQLLFVHEPLKEIKSRTIWRCSHYCCWRFIST